MNEKKKERCKDWPNDDDTEVPVPTDDGLTSIGIISNELYFTGSDSFTVNFTMHHHWYMGPSPCISNGHRRQRIHSYFMANLRAHTYCLHWLLGYCSWSPCFVYCSWKGALFICPYGEINKKSEKHERPLTFLKVSLSSINLENKVLSP